MEDIFANVLNAVCYKIGVDKSESLTSNKEECVDARSIICAILSDVGFTDNEISLHLNVTRQCVNKLRCNFIYRLNKWTVRMIYRELRIEFVRNGSLL